MINRHHLKRLSLSILITAGLVFGLNTTSYADNRVGSRAYDTGEHSESQAAAKARAKYGGKVLSVSTSDRDGRKVYKVKLLLESGRIKIVTISD